MLLFLTACDSKDTLTIQTTAQNISLSVEIADSPEEHAEGLMERTTLPNNQGMLFIFPDEKQRIFWMKNMSISLDILFMDAAGKIVDIKKDFHPCTADPCELYYSLPAMYVLEVNVGFVQKHGVEIGDVVRFTQS